MNPVVVTDYAAEVQALNGDSRQKYTQYAWFLQIRFSKSQLC